VARLAHATLVGFKDVNAKIDALADSQILLTDAQSRTDKSLADTIEKMRNVDEKIDVLVESQIRLTEAQSRTKNW
jgi:hypothetical protein